MVVKRPKVVNAGARPRYGPTGRWVYGINAVQRRIEVHPESVLEVCVATRERTRLKELLRQLPQHVPVREVDDVVLTRLAASSAHQGIVARTNRFAYVDLEAVLSDNPRLLLMVDRMQDPQNFGALLRTAAAAGVAAVVIPRDGAVGVTPAVEKAAAGAANDIPVCQIVNVRRTLDVLAQQGYWRVGLSPHGSANLYATELPDRLVVLLGGEGGIRPLVAEACDFQVAIPMARAEIESLNASAAGAVVLFELMRRRLLDR